MQANIIYIILLYYINVQHVLIINTSRMLKSLLNFSVLILLIIFKIKHDRKLNIFLKYFPLIVFIFIIF